MTSQPKALDVVAPQGVFSTVAPTFSTIDYQTIEVVESIVMTRLVVAIHLIQQAASVELDAADVQPV